MCSHCLVSTLWTTACTQLRRSTPGCKEPDDMLSHGCAASIVCWKNWHVCFHNRSGCGVLLRTLEPRAGPMGGEGFAFPPVSSSLILPVTVKAERAWRCCELWCCHTTIHAGPPHSNICALLRVCCRLNSPLAARVITLGRAAAHGFGEADVNAGALVERRTFTPILHADDAILNESGWMDDEGKRCDEGKLS